MEKSATQFLSVRSTLWEEQCRNSCIVFDQCGGNFTAPCGCVKKGEERFKCSSCEIICRNREAPSTKLFSEDTFTVQIKSGLPIEDVHIKQCNPEVPFPIFIPTYTHRIGFKTKYPFIGIQLDQLLTKALQPNLRSALSTKEKAKRVFNFSSKNQVIAILNTNDEYLEALWRMSNRNDFYTALKNIGIKYVTGPTFSVIKETKKHPASHNVAMLMRHNRIVQELYDHGLIPIPNIYWRSEFDIDNWTTWLLSNNSINIIVRDFSMISKGVGYRASIERFLKFLNSVKKPFHVLFTGIGIVNAAYLMREFNNMQHTCTFVSSDPITNAVFGGKKLSPKKLQYVRMRKQSKKALVKYNLKTFEDILIQQLPKVQHDQVSIFNT